MTEILMFGDSFIKFFKLYKTKKIKIFAYSGKTMKSIEKIIPKINKKIQENKNVKYIFFNFGQVDLYLSYYYANYYSKKGFDMNNIIKNYIKEINKIKTTAEKIILDVYPSPLIYNNIELSLKKYLDKNIAETIINNKNFKKDTIIGKRFQRYERFSNLLKNNSKSNNLKFISFKDIILTKNNKIKKKFLDISPINIHITWEPFILEVDKSNKLKKYGFNNKYLKNLKKSYEEYLKSKKNKLNK
jgi:hypothetical protein